MVGNIFKMLDVAPSAHHVLSHFVLHNEMEQQIVGRDGTKKLIFNQLPTIRYSISVYQTKWNNKWWAETVPKS